MKQKLRILSLLLAVGLTVGLLAGCSRNREENNSSTPSGDGTASGNVPTLVWWTVGGTGQKREEAFAEFNKYTAEEIGVKIDLKVAGWNDFGQKMNTIINSGESFDIMFTNGNDYNRYASLGAFADLTDMVETTIPELYEFVPSTVWDGVKVNNKIYGVPTYKDSAMAQYWVWDKGMALEYGLNPDELLTLQDLDPALRKIKESKGRSFYPFILDKAGLNGWSIEYDGMGVDSIGLGVRIDDESRQVVSILEQPDIMEKLRILHQWFEDGIINPDAPTASEMPKYRMLGSLQTFPGQEADTARTMGLEQTETTGVQLVRYAGPYYSTSSIQGSVNAISASSKYKTEALRYLQMVNMDPTLRDMYCYGLEGTHYTRIDENTVRLNNEIEWGLAAYTQGTFATRSLVEGTPADQWEQIKAQNEAATPSVLLGWMLDIEDLTDEVANCRAIWDKYQAELLTGASDPDVVVPKIISEWKAVGWDQIREEAQRQINAHFGG